MAEEKDMVIGGEDEEEKDDDEYTEADAYYDQQKNMRLNIDSAIYVIKELNKLKSVPNQLDNRVQLTYKTALNLICDSFIRLNPKYEEPENEG